jgi:cytochrome b561
MSIRNTTSQYGSLSRFFHWTIFLCVLVMIPLGYLMVDIQDKALRGQIINVHKLIGVLILVLMLLRT